MQTVSASERGLRFSRSKPDFKRFKFSELSGSSTLLQIKHGKGKSHSIERNNCRNRRSHCHGDHRHGRFSNCV